MLYVEQINETTNDPVLADKLRSRPWYIRVEHLDGDASQLEYVDPMYVANEQSLAFEDHQPGFPLNTFSKPAVVFVSTKHGTSTNLGTASIRYIRDHIRNPRSSSLTDPFVLVSEPNPVLENLYGRAKFPIESDIPECLNEELEIFKNGVEGIKPTFSVFQSAYRIVAVANEFVPEPDITMDVDGELSFYLTLTDGRLVMAELAIDGSIDASVYDDQDRLLERLPAMTEDAFKSVLKS